MSVSPLHGFLGGLLVAVIVAVALVPSVIEPTLYRRKFQLGSCNITDMKLNASLIDCSCGFSCSSKKKCLIATVEYSVNLTDPTVRYFSNVTEGKGLLRDKRQKQTSAIHCTNTGCSSNTNDNIERADSLEKKLGDRRTPFLCRINVDSPDQEKVYDSFGAEEEEEGHVILLAFIIPWGTIYVFLIAISIFEQRACNQSPTSTTTSGEDSGGIEDHRFQTKDEQQNDRSESQESTPSIGSRRGLVEDKISVDFSGGAVVFKKKL